MPIGPQDLEYPENEPVVPRGKEHRVLSIMIRWVNGEIDTAQADRELQITGVKLPKFNSKGE